MRRLLDRARSAGLEPLVLSRAGATSWAGAPEYVVVHQPASPEARAVFLSGDGPATLALTPREFDIWTASSLGRATASGDPLWGDRLPVAEEDDVEGRRRRLRSASRLWWHAVPNALGRDGHGAEAEANALRAICERETLPSRFPPIPPPGADADTLHAATLGVVHATFAGEVAPDTGAQIDPDATAAPPRTLAPLLELLRPLVADLPRHVHADLLSLHLVPGPWGTRHAWQLLAVVADDAPLHGAAALRRRLDAHLGMIGDGWRGTLSHGPVVLTRAALHGQLTRRLFHRPLRRLGLRLHASLLIGEDTIADGLRGADWTPLDLRAEIAALLTATGAAFRPGTTDVAMRDLLLGAWPALLHLCGGGSPLDSLASIHAALAGRTDPALARVGSVALKQPWGRPEAVDRGRATEGLRDWGPILVRMQEAALEVLG